MLLFLIPLATGCTLMQRKPAPTYDARTFYETTIITGASFNHDESRLLVSSDASGVFNVYSQPFEGGAMEPLTRSTTESMWAISYFPQDGRFLYSSDQGGNELNHIYVRELDGTVRDLTPGDKTKASFTRWSTDRKSFYIETNERDPQFFDVYRYDADTYARERIFTNPGGWSVADVSRDGRWVALAKIRNNADSDIYLYDVARPDAELKHITPHTGNVFHNVLSFTPDSARLMYLTNGHGEFKQAWSYDLADGQHRQEVAADWDVMYVYFSERGRYRVTGINEDARTTVSVHDTHSNRPVKFPKVPGADIKGVVISRSETRLAFYVDGDDSPSNLHVMDLTSGGHRQLTQSLNPKIDPGHLVRGEVVRYPSFDGLKIPAILYRPHGASGKNPVPALVWVHGGPGGQSRHGYNAMRQHLVNHGYALLAVNNRGSSGYGKTFFHLDDKAHGEGDLQDCIWGRRYLETLDWVDGGRVGIIGGSYGGFMVAAALAFEPDAFDVGINIFGVTNWLRTLQSIPPWWADFREALYTEMGDPATDEERLRRISPLFHAANIKRPLLVVQGANDPRVLQVESDELVEAVRRNNVPVEYVIFPDEGHGFLKKENQIRASNAYVEFLAQHLGGR